MRFVKLTAIPTILIIALSIISCRNETPGNVNTNIHVTFNEENPDTLYFFFDPGLSLDLRELKCEIDSAGTCNLNLEIENSSLVWVTNNGYLCWLMVSPGNDISVTFLGQFYHLPYDNNEESSSIIEGDNMLGNVELNRLIKSKYSFSEVKFELDSIDAESIVKIGHDVFENELSAFDDLLASNYIDTVFYKAISKYLEYSNAYVLVNTINSYLDKNEILKEEKSKLLRIIEQTYDDLPLNNDWVLIMGTNLHNYIFDYLKYKELANPDEYKQQVDAGNKNTYQYQLLKEVCSPITFEKIGLSFLVSKSYLGGGKEELKLYYSYVNEYPNKKYPHLLSMLEDNIRSIKSLVSHEAKKLSTNTHIIEDSEEIYSLEELLSNFKGSNLYVDIWASWCAPCLGEHQESDLLKEYAEEVGLKLLYISVDNQSEEDKWMNYIKQYELKGYHILANEKLIQNLEQEIPDFGGIPRYLIINKDGEIVDNDAKRPSDGESLVEELKEKIGL